MKLINHRFRLILFTIFFSSVLAACGGGGSDSTSITDDSGGSGGSGDSGSGDSEVTIVGFGVGFPNGLVDPDPTVAKNCADGRDFYTATLKQNIAKCLECHITGGLAESTRLILDENNDAKSFNGLVRFMDDASNTDLIIKPINFSFNLHSGGQMLMGEDDPTYINLWKFTHLSESCDQIPGEPPPQPSVELVPATQLADRGFAFSDNEETLRRATIILAGRLPSNVEIAAANVDENGLRSTLKTMMDGDGFRNFIDRTANTSLLTGGAIEGLGDQNFDQAFGDDLAGQAETDLFESLAQEPLRIIQYIVENDRSYEEVVTANYTLVDTVTAPFYSSSPVATSDNLPIGWTKATIPTASVNSPGVAYPHAGVLSTPAWLSRFPTTDTNRNRHRVLMMYRQFLGVDIELLGQRPNNDDEDSGFPVPLMQDPACTLCHSFMDPAAGAFMDFGPDSRYRKAGGNPALSDDYIAGSSEDYPLNLEENEWYQNGDFWYRDVFSPGFEIASLPGNYAGLSTNTTIGNTGTSTLSWMTNELIKDGRFAKGAVKFWYQGLFGRDTLDNPVDENDPDFTERRAAFDIQNAYFNELAFNFKAGGYIVRDLLVDMVTSQLFKVNSIGSADVNDPVLEEIGMFRLLTPEELDLKTEYIFEISLFESYTDGKAQQYGGYDGGISGSARNEDMTPIMSTIITEVINQALCIDNTFVLDEFAIATKANRKLLINAESTDSPDNGGAADDRIKQNIQYLYKVLLAEDLAVTDEEITKTFELFKSTHDGDTSSGACSAGGARVAAWNSVLAYLMGDFKYLNN